MNGLATSGLIARWIDLVAAAIVGLLTFRTRKGVQVSKGQRHVRDLRHRTHTPPARLFERETVVDGQIVRRTRQCRALLRGSHAELEPKRPAS